MFKILGILLLAALSVNAFSFVNIISYAKYLYPRNLTYLSAGVGGNELWRGILKDCSKKLTFSCLQKNAYSYLDNTLGEIDNVTIFDGILMTKNNLDYGTCEKNCEEDTSEEDNLVEDRSYKENFKAFEEPETPLEEVTSALRHKTVKFLATRDYEIQLPEFVFEKAKIKISPREIDSNGALVRIDFGSPLEQQGRLFKKIREFSSC